MKKKLIIIEGPDMIGKSHISNKLKQFCGCEGAKFPLPQEEYSKRDVIDYLSEMISVVDSWVDKRDEKPLIVDRFWITSLVHHLLENGGERDARMVAASLMVKYIVTKCRKYNIETYFNILTYKNEEDIKKAIHRSKFRFQDQIDDIDMMDDESKLETINTLNELYKSAPNIIESYLGIELNKHRSELFYMGDYSWDGVKIRFHEVSFGNEADVLNNIIHRGGA